MIEARVVSSRIAVTMVVVMPLISQDAETEPGEVPAETYQRGLARSLVEARQRSYVLRTLP